MSSQHFSSDGGDEQGDKMKNNVKKLVENGQLEFINGGWCMNDEASTHYNSIIDQMTVGLVRLNDTFGPVAFPRIGWQIDPFGHSNEQASLFAQMGMDGELFARVDYRDKVNRWDSRRMEMIWKSSHSLGEDSSWIFTGVLPHHYEPPSGFCFDNQCGDDPIMDDPNLEDYNKDDKVRSFIQAVNYEVTGFISNQNIIMTMGSDFHYVNANSWYKNLDKLIKYVNELQTNGSNINVVYSTPSCYVDALHSENITWPNKTDDFFPYATDEHSYWTGYFTSRPTLKGFERQGNNILQVVKQFASLTGSSADESIKTLAEAMGVLQHHDAVAGTSKQHVADDYYLMLTKGVDNARGLLSKGFSYFTGNDESTEFTYCPLLNISSCSYLEGKTSFVVNVYNSIGRPKSFYVRVPVEESLNYTVQDQQGNSLESQVVPLPEQIVNLPGRTSTANFDLVFYAQDIPALGALQYLVEVAAEESTNKRSSILSNIKEIIDGKDTVVEN
ncbi:Epididymis-specific alpha-mannosidase [Armadillidium vulgare]|nr:Epididymis-specific alpha-mannosidase [Armadillidium vulgare]